MIVMFCLTLLQWSVLQYVIIRPAISIAGIICQAYGVLCESGPWSFKTANSYFEVIDGVSITYAQSSVG